MDYGQEHTCQHGEPWGEDNCTPPEWWHTARLLGAVRDGEWLDAQDFPPVRWAVPGIIAEGLTLLVGAPKAGKSWLALDALLAIACGGKALGHITVTPGPTLYMAMEDGDRRMQDRARHLLANGPIPRGFNYVTGQRVKPGNIVTTIEAWMGAHPDTRMVVIDTLGRVMPSARQGETSYERDYRIGAALKTLADKYPGLAVVVVHHTRKAMSADFIESVSGTQGLAGAADAVVVLNRDRDSAEGTLSVTGRDVDEGIYAVTGLPASARLDGRTLGEAANRARQRQQSEGLGDQQQTILRMVDASPDGITPTAIAAEMGISSKLAGTYLGRLVEAGRVRRLNRGFYGPVESVESVETTDVDSTVSTLSTPLEDVPLWEDGESGD